MKSYFLTCEVAEHYNSLYYTICFVWLFVFVNIGKMHLLSAAHSASVASGLQMKSARDDVLLLHCDETCPLGVLPFSSVSSSVTGAFS